MGLDFDVLEFCRKLRTAKQPPYTCPVVECGKTYKSMCGLQYHLVNFDHTEQRTAGPEPKPEPTPDTAPTKKIRKKSRLSKSPKDVKENKVPRDSLTFSEAQKLVEVEVDDQVLRIHVDETVPVISQHNYDLLHSKGSTAGTIRSSIETAKNKDLIAKLPEPCFSILDDYTISNAPPKPVGYIRFIEKSAEDLDGEVEYDMDEDDAAWLDIMNEKRNEQGLGDVPVESFELLMDRLEKESFFQMKTNKSGDGSAVIDDDAVCCICMDGECQNSNVILFCDMCNLAVHQDCYGVPYIPEGQWLCRRCLQSPSRAVDCVLCPNNGGAFKQTDRGHWAHVVCALWIPEVRFANIVFLEPIDSIETIPAARWKLTCYLCKQKGVGACIQCHKTNCYSAFHVTCAQHAGLYMKMDAIKDPSFEGETAPVLVQKIAYCGTHTPADAENRPKLPVTLPYPRKSVSKSTAPVISIPTIPPDRIQEIGSLITIAKKNQFIQRLIAYWTLKRQLRNGVPLLRRLQASHMSRKDEGSCSGKNINDVVELRRQLKYWQCLRQDLERARLLCELVRKREKLKKELVKVKSLCLEVELCPLVSFLRRLVDLLRSRDTGEIFIEPVDQTEVPDYSDVVKHPMDLSTMRHKVDTFQYNSLAEFQADFYLMISNCLAYNAKDTVFYRAGLKMRDQGGALLRQAQKDLEEMGLESGCHEIDSSCNDNSVSNIDSEIERLTAAVIHPGGEEDIINKLNKLLECCQCLRHGLARSKRVKIIKTLIAKLKRRIESVPHKRQGKEISEGTCDISTDEENSKPEKKRRKKNALHIRERKREKRKSETVDSPKGDIITGMPVTTPIKDSLPKTSNVVSPSGVNRRTAVLFTRKAAAALRNPVTSSSPSVYVKVSNTLCMNRRRGRQMRSINLDVLCNTSAPSSDSFSMYRSGDVSVKSDESHSDDDSSCSDTCSSSHCGSSSGTSSDWSDSEDSCKDSPKEALEQLQLVWAKCRGYPWYPALIINPKMPRGYVHNGVPIPSPPADVIALANNYTEPVYLVLFFDTKRTWQWLPRNKLEPLGVTYELDNIKLTESRKPTDRKAVKKAYQEAMMHRTNMDKKSEPVISPDKIL